MGDSGDDVAQVQQRLTDLGFWPGPVDGVYGDETIKSVWAYEKLVLGTPSDAPTGQVTPEMWDAMQDPFVDRAAADDLDTDPRRGVPARAGRGDLRGQRSR